MSNNCVTINRVSYFNQTNCYRLSNGIVDVIVTTDIGPRIIFYGLTSQNKNILSELPDVKVTTALGDWKPWGGHRLWHAPESMPRTYCPDNSPVSVKIEGYNSIRLTQNVEKETGIQKEMLITLDSNSSQLIIKHICINKSLWDIELAPWGVTIMKKGGQAIIPQEPYKRHEDALTPARPIVTWHYTDLTDKRLRLGKQLVFVKPDSNIKEPLKIGFGNKQCWGGYLLGNLLFIKHFPYYENGKYCDYGCNIEIYTQSDFIEIETLAPLSFLAPGESSAYDERWNLFDNVVLSDKEDISAQTLEKYTKV